MLPGWETALAALGGLVLGVGIATWFGLQRERRLVRMRVELESRLRRDVLPVLERRANVLGIPAADRGHNDDGPIALVQTLARAIKLEEESHELPFGDTLQASREALDEEREATEER